MGTCASCYEAPIYQGHTYSHNSKITDAHKPLETAHENEIVQCKLNATWLQFLNSCCLPFNFIQFNPILWFLHFVFVQFYILFHRCSAELLTLTVVYREYQISATQFLQESPKSYFSNAVTLSNFYC